ncbi:hypothetical protein [Acutalibacter sp. 1XD8-33]|nr:hypothetical protein [Acutalibacter sp. 1XD8-33]
MRTKPGFPGPIFAKIESPTRAFGVSMETLFALAEALEVPVAKLFEE